MTSIFGRWLAYGLGRSLGDLARGDDGDREGGRTDRPVRVGTEADFRRDEERFREDEERIEAGSGKRARRP